VSGGIAERDGGVVGAADDLATDHHDRADRHLAGREPPSSLVEGRGHELLVAALGHEE
jgi:hypothetical protein